MAFLATALDLIRRAFIEYFREAGLDRKYNVPSFLSFVDNQGNEEKFDILSDDKSERFIDLRCFQSGILFVGDILRIDVDVDSLFDNNSNYIEWFNFNINGISKFRGETAEIIIENKHVGNQFAVHFELKSERGWHKSHGFDEKLILIYEVSPPLR